MSSAQRRVLEAIRSYIATYRIPPTVRELGGQLGVKESTVFSHLNGLERRGLITRRRNSPRSIVVVEHAA